jgi:hypothetical protein
VPQLLQLLASDGEVEENEPVFHHDGAPFCVEGRRHRVLSTRGPLQADTGARFSAGTGSDAPSGWAGWG